MSVMVDRVCANPHCAKAFRAKKADVDRGWAKCCCKACAAWSREKRLDRNGYRKPQPRKLEWPRDFLPKSGDLLARIQFHEMCHSNVDHDQDSKYGVVDE